MLTGPIGFFVNTDFGMRHGVDFTDLRFGNLSKINKVVAASIPSII